MEKFETLTVIAAPMRNVVVDTDRGCHLTELYERT